jgi:diacylglycerol kinase (CTP)
VFDDSRQMVQQKSRHELRGEIKDMPIESPTARQPQSAQGLKQKSDIHLSRKLTHAFGVCTIAAIYNFESIKICWIIIVTALLIVVPLDFLRLSQPSLNRAALAVFGPVMRRHESSGLSGMSYLLIACPFLLFLNVRPVVTLTLLFLAFGDPIASFFGIRYGKDRILGNKTLQGTMASFVVCTVIAGVFYYFNNLMTERLFIVVPLSGLIGALAELIPIGKLDDNLTFPVVGSILLWLLFKVYGGFAI